MKSLLIGAAMVALLAPPAFAQSSSPQNQPGASTNSNSGANMAAAQKIKQDLQSAGFTDVKVVAESFVVQAKSKDGDPVLMTIGPRGMSVFEAKNNSKPDSSSTTGSSSNSMKSGSQSK
jgi:opacity protein-like surface antigen